MASGTVACGALMRNCSALLTISRCRVVFLDMLGGQGNIVVEIFNLSMQLPRDSGGPEFLWIESVILRVFLCNLHKEGKVGS